MTHRVHKFLTAAAVTPMLVLGAAGTSFAQDSDVSWGGGGLCLQHLPDPDEVVLSGGQTCNYSAELKQWGQVGWQFTWHDDNSNLEDPDGAWAEKTPGRNGKCLTTFWQHQVYLEPCSNPVNYYEQWYEEWRNGNWHLKNRETKACLTHTRDAQVTTRDSCDWNDPDQLWH